MFSMTSSKFDSLPTRPPTPPKELSKAVDDAISFLNDSYEVDRLLNEPRIQHDAIVSTTEVSPVSSRAIDHVSNASKKVGFSPNPTYYKSAEPDQSISPDPQSLKRSALTRSAKPLKSILKPADAPVPLTPEDLDSKLSVYSPEIPGSFAKMLQSVIQQLAGPSRSSRLDAYLALNGVLQTYDGVPDTSAMVQKMDLIMQFLSRDIAWKDSEGSLDVNIISQALKLTMAIFCNAKLAEALDDDFKTFLFDRSITVLEQSDMPKALIKTHLYVLSQQRFRVPVGTNGRADKLLSALQTIEERCSGNSVIATRLIVYLRLVEQAPTVMLTRIRDWLEHIFHGMLSSVKDVRTRAIEVCTRAGLSFGLQSHAGRALQELFDTPVEEQQTYCDYLMLRLAEMMAEKEKGFAADVPQIWSSVILFFRSKRMPLEKWPTFRNWLQIIQKCFNSSDITIRYQALRAWDRLVFTIMPASTASRGLFFMLKIPICAGLEKRGADKFSQQLRQYALESYCNLLHYAFRPGLFNEEHDAAWDVFVDPVLSDLAKSSGKGRYNACRILHGLLNGNTGVWNVNAAIEQAAIKPEELPKLEPRWVRSRLARTIKLLEPLIADSMRSAPEANAALDAIWHSLMKSVADAGNQEIKTSMDLKQGIALLVNMFRRLWSSSTQENSGADMKLWLDRYVSLVEMMAKSLGTAHFVEEILSTTEDDIVEVAPTPSHRHSTSHGTPQSPLDILFTLFCYPPSAWVVGEAYESAAFIILRRLTSSKSSFQQRLEILSRSRYTWSRAFSGTLQSSVKEYLWTALARNTILALKPEEASSDGQESQGLGHGLREAVDMLVAGVEVAESADAYDVIKKLYDAIYDTAKVSAADGGIVLALMEPFAKALSNAAPSTPLRVKLYLVCYMLGKAVWPRTRQSLEQTRKIFWGVGLAPHKTMTFDPFEHVYVLIRDLAIAAYDNFDTRDPLELDLTQIFVSSVVSFLEKSPLSLLAIALRKIQDGLVVWIEDKSRKTGGADEISEVIQNAWIRVIQLLESLPTKDGALLKALESLLVAGFLSPHKSVVNTTIVFWNNTFGNELSLEYPPKLEKALRARVVDADISLPTFPNSNEESIPASLPAFFESQGQLPVGHTFPKPVGGLRRNNTHLSTSQPTNLSPCLLARRSPISQQRSVSSPAKKRPRSSASSTPKPRLRHDDSQIQFAPIDSSPLPQENESQLLTEHQKEVNARQQQNAQLFPDLSSSPLARSTALPQAVSKRLNFASHAHVENENEAPGTPSGLPDVNGLMSDDLPSSPTPLSTKDAVSGIVQADDDQELDDAQEDPPSSPPRDGIESEDQPAGSIGTKDVIEEDETTIDVTNYEVARLNQRGPEKESAMLSPNANNESKQGSELFIVASEFPSDSALPNMQLYLEEEGAASGSERKNIDTTEAEEESFNSTSATTRARKARNKQPSQFPQAPNAELELSEDVTNNHEQDVTRVENSFVEPDAAHAEMDSQSNNGSQRSQRDSKKRKRSKQITYPAKKRKQQSPFQRLTSYIWTQDQQDDDDDIGEEIVVASSQRSSSPVANVSRKPTSSPSNLVDTTSNSVGEVVGVVKEEPGSIAIAPPPKRRRGRPRKSETPTTSRIEVVPPKTLKRKASALSNASTTSSPISSSFVKGTPLSKKHRKRGSDNHERTPSSSKISEQTLRASRVAAKRAEAEVVVESTKRGSDRATEVNNTDEIEQLDDENVDIATPEQQLEMEQAATAPHRPIATPRSILKRMRDALSDFRGMIMGSQEEREFDNVLFEFRREAHEAGRRGREAL